MKHPNSMTKDYEYKVYDCVDGQQPAFLAHSQSHAPIIVMARHEGFQWNDELFVNPFRRGAGGCISHKSADRLERESRVSGSTALTSSSNNTTDQRQQQQQQHEEDSVVQIQLSEADRDIWP
ncbi:hypothetical protein BDB00DRAFT_823489 [Zychaea mexicana]|uniref:uncharacterized protein n=1 Tax=Zychaea mexicana TaxID=64656 RepID=UPI0022FE2C0D|nr:uncharacterized protein BDB00DRAFT_823489 [Zychaea mexicana]KAI9493317.1 hypothetical protein BDB00DRAFT_823489 [Zychaea mexicana]